MYSFLEKNKKYLINIPLIVYWLILFVLTSLPSKSAITIGVSDKIEHFGAYGILASVLYVNLYFQKKFKKLNKYPGTFTLIFASLYGVMDELHQLFVPGRTADILDWTADFLGVMLGILITRVLIEKLKQMELKKSN